MAWRAPSAAGADFAHRRVGPPLRAARAIRVARRRRAVGSAASTRARATASLRLRGGCAMPPERLLLSIRHLFRTFLAGAREGLYMNSALGLTSRTY